MNFIRRILSKLARTTKPSKKILAIALSALLGLASVTGIVIAVQKTTAQSVLVVPASSVNYGGYYYSENYMSGEVTSDVSQTVYLSDVETVSEILVEEGQAVHIGDVLMTYDTTRTGIALEKELLNRERIELQIRAANKNLEILSGISPTSDGDFDLPVDFDDFDDFEDDESEDENYRDKPKYSVFDETVDPINLPEREGEEEESLLGTVGTPENPLVFLTSDEVVTLTDSFIERWKQYAADRQMENLYICIKRVDENGVLISAWVQDVCLLPAITFQLSMLDGTISFTPEELAALIALASESGADTLEQVLVIINEKYPDLLSGMTDEQLLHIFAGLDEATRDRFMQILASLSAEKDSEKSSDDDKDDRSEDDSKSVDDTSEDNRPGGDDNSKSGSDTDTSDDTGQSDNTDKSGGEGTSGDADKPGNAGESGDEDKSGNADTSGDTDKSDGAEASGGTVTGRMSSGSLNLFRSSYILDQNALRLLSPANQSGDDGSTSASGTILISPDASYTREELAEAKKNEQDKIEELQLDLRESELKIKEAQKAVESGVVTARINGVVKYVGDPDNTGIGRTKMIEVTSAEGLFVQSAIPENMLQTVREGDIVTVTSWQSGGVFEAQVRDISQYPDSSNRYNWSEYSTQSYYPFIAYIADGGNSLSNGEWVEITYDEAANAFNHIEESSAVVESTEIDDADETDDVDYADFYLWKVFIREEGSRKYVFVRGENGKLEKRYIETGELSDSSYKILSGITQEDYVAFPYGSNVREGAPTREGSVDDLY